MPQQIDLQEALRSMLLPTAPEHDAEVIAAAESYLVSRDVHAKDRGLWILLEIEEWRSAGAAGRELRAMVRACLQAGDTDYGEGLAASYFRLHKRLASTPLFNHDRASAFLSHARLMAILAGQERFSAAQIARVIAARDQRVPLTWDLVEAVLRPLGLDTSLTPQEMAGLFNADVEAEEELLADASPQECAEILGDVAQRLGYPGDLTTELLTLAPPESDVHGPYLQMLHYLCVVAELYDHALSALYEFDPRSTIGAPDWLFDQYPPSLNVSGNPFLNNAKSVREIDRAWAWSKRGAQKAPAHALVSIIDGLESLGYAARQELAAWLRRWLCRLIRIAAGVSINLPQALSEGERERLLARTASENTQSRGIIEQRVVDALSILLHPNPPWIARGVGDAVNANNVSRRKCGDADFQDTSNRRVVAYEAHGGTLTDVYLRDHCRTLKPILGARRAEWDANVSPGQVWTADIVYVAHAIGLSQEISSYGFYHAATDVSFHAMTYTELISKATNASPKAELAASIEDHLVRVMTEERTPDIARSRLLELIGP